MFKLKSDLKSDTENKSKNLHTPVYLSFHYIL